MHLILVVIWVPVAQARMHTGLTADCTHLDIDMNGYIQYLKEGSTMDVDSIKFNMGRHQLEDDVLHLAVI